MHVYVWEHIVSLSYRTDRWMFTKAGRDEELMVPLLLFFDQIYPGVGPGWGKIGHGVSFFNKLLLHTGRLQQQT